jgi:CRP-like cAMP-binding protein
MTSLLELPVRQNSTAAQKFTARSRIPARTDYLWQIQAGVVRTTTKLEEGSTVVLGIWGAGGVVGRPLTHAKPYQIECITRVEAIALPLTEVSDFSEILLAQIYQAETLTQIRSYKRIDLVLTKFLGWLAEQFGKEVEQGRLLDLRMTHFDLAEAIGTTRVTITRILSQLEQQGIIECLPLRRIVVRESECWHYEI